MRILGIETSSRRGSVALLEDDVPVATLEHEEQSAHAERVLRLINELISGAGWPRSSLDRIAVGVGPGSFVGLRVGIALAEGLSLGLGRPVVGVCSLHAMLAAVPHEIPKARAALLDARRGELFLAATHADGRELSPPRAVPLVDVPMVLAALGSDLLLTGEIARTLNLPQTILSGGDCDLPHARWVAALARAVRPEDAPAIPLYVRGPGAVQPNLPPSPFASSGGQPQG